MTEKQIIIIMRFNINYTKFETSPMAKNIDTSKDVDYLKNRFYIFENITLPSLLCLKNKEDYNLKIIFITSKDLHPEYLEKFKHIIKKQEYFELQFYDEMNGNQYIKKFLNPNVKLYATVRMDDDDALDSNYLNLLGKYLTDENIGKIISFPYGYSIKKIEDVWQFKAEYNKLIACGLARITQISETNTIYNGSHTQWENLGFDCIYDSTPGVYVISNHSYGDSKRHYRDKNFIPVNVDFRKQFPFIKIFNEVRGTDTNRQEIKKNNNINLKRINKLIP